jgi:ATP-binding cassette subfamily C protein
MLPVATGAQVRAQLRMLGRGRWPLFAATAAAMVAESLLGLVGPIAIGWITQAVADREHVAALAGPVALLAAAAVAAAAIGWAATVLLARLVLPAVARLREDAVSMAVELPIDTVEAGGIGDLVSRVSGDADIVSDAATDAIGGFVGSGLAILSTLVGLAALDWRFAFAGLLAVPIQAHTLRWYLRTSRPIYAAGRRADGRRTSALLTGFTALPTLRALRLGRRQRDRIAVASADSMGYELRATRAATRFYGRLNLAELVGLGAILLVAFLLVRAGLATVGEATTAALFFAGLFDPINTALGVFDGIQQAGAGLARLVGVATAGDGPRHRPSSTAEHSAPPQELTASGVRFGYGEGPDVLHDVTLRVPPGEHVSVVGTTGSGKSTLASLLTGLRTPREGSIAYGGTPLDGFDLPQRSIALVTQETHLFAGTLADNLRLARPDATREQLAASLAEVGAADWIDSLPDGLDTPLGASGHALTPSQAQQLALARVILLDPPLIVLDEATAEAGSDAARALDRAAQAAVRGRSAVIVAHRLSQAATADRIVVMEHGRVIECGSHERLRDAGGPYARLWSAWSDTPTTHHAGREDPERAAPHTVRPAGPTR